MLLVWSNYGNSVLEARRILPVYETCSLLSFCIDWHTYMFVLFVCTRVGTHVVNRLITCVATSKCDLWPCLLRCALVLSPAITGGAQCMLSSYMPVEELFPFRTWGCSYIGMFTAATYMTLGRTQYSADMCCACHCIAQCRAPI